MEGLFLLGGLFLLVSVVLPLYLAVALGGLKRRITALEAKLSETRAPVMPPVDTREATSISPSVPAPDPSKAPLKPGTAWQPAPKVKPARSAFVFSGKKLSQFSKWAQDNWVFMLAGVSLALAGVFLVQYGVENGLLSPAMRVLAAIGFGAVLIGVGEYIRRKSSGDEAGDLALLPSVFAGAGLVAIFAGVLSARMLYGLIEQETAFIGLALTGGLAILLGWVYGPLLATLGVFGALAAPFLVGGGSNNAGPLHIYFALIAAVALAIDAYRRWAWLSVLALIGAFGASWLLFIARDTGFYAVLFAFLVAIMAVAIPLLSLTPRHKGARLSGVFTGGLKAARIAFPTRVAGGVFLAANGYIWLAYQSDASLFWLVLMVAGLLLLAALFWMKNAPALADIAFAPPLLAVLVIAYEALLGRPVALAWIADAGRDVLDMPSKTVALLLVGAVLASFGFAWRSAFLPPLRVANAAFAAGFAPVVAIMIELRWAPGYVLGAGLWAIYLAMIAAVMVALTERFARLDPPKDRTRTALFALSSMSMLAFVAVVLLGGVALTLALGVMVLGAAWLGKRFGLGLLEFYVKIGVLAVSFRLVVEPGLFWAYDAPLWEPALAFLGSISLLAVAWRIKRGGAASSLVVLESAIWTLGGIFITLMVARWTEANHAQSLAYVTISLAGMVWLMLSANQLYRLKAGGRLWRLRVVLGAIYGVVGALTMAVAAGSNPANLWEMRATGWMVFGSLGVAYLLPALLLGIMGWKLRHLPRWLRGVFWASGAGFAALFVVLEIRHFWQGDDMAGYGTLKPELYSYTVAMILFAISLFVLAYLRQSAGLRKLALLMVALVVAKVYFIDVSELDGLLRVVSLLVLGLVAALMAWGNRLLKSNETQQTAQAETKA